jgi:hypothetical protein
MVHQADICACLGLIDTLITFFPFFGARHKKTFFARVTFTLTAFPRLQIIQIATLIRLINTLIALHPFFGYRPGNTL